MIPSLKWQWCLFFFVVQCFRWSFIIERYFELYATFFMIWNYCTGDYLVYNFAYLELEPIFECLQEDGATYAKCTSKEYCSLDSDSTRIDYSNAKSLRNWQTDLNLACKCRSISLSTLLDVYSISSVQLSGALNFPHLIIIRFKSIFLKCLKCLTWSCVEMN